MPTTARAVRFDSYGPVDRLHVDRVTVPDPTGEQVLIAVRAAGINPGEAAIRRGELDAFAPSTFPSGQGSDVAGVVAAIGPDVLGLAAGDEVLGWSWERSSHATHVLVPATQLVPKPAGLPWEVAGSLYVAGATAWAATAAVEAAPGETVVVSAAAGGVGTLATQLLVARGVRVVGIASATNADWLTAHGAVPVIYGPGLVDRVRDAAPDGVAALVDLHGPEYVDLGLELRVPPERINTIIAFGRAAEVGARTEGSTAGTNTEVLGELASLAATGQLDVEIAGTYPLEDVVAAFTDLERGHTRGKVVLTMTAPLPDDDPARDLMVTSADAPDVEHLGMVGDTYTVLLSGHQTAGAYTLVDMLVPAGGGPGSHRHDFEELFVLLEGEITVTFRGTEQLVRPGDVVNVPANAPHHFRNTSDAPARMLCMCSPAAQEDFFRAAAEHLPHRTSRSSQLEGEAFTAWVEAMGRLAPSYRSELLLT